MQAPSVPNANRLDHVLNSGNCRVRSARNAVSASLGISTRRPIVDDCESAGIYAGVILGSDSTERLGVWCRNPRLGRFDSCAAPLADFGVFVPLWAFVSTLVELPASRSNWTAWTRSSGCPGARRAEFVSIVSCAVDSSVFLYQHGL
jgi:hypothetical protein